MRQINNEPDGDYYQIVFIVCGTSILWASLALPGGLRMGLITYLMALLIHACCIVTLRIVFLANKQRRCSKYSLI